MRDIATVTSSGPININTAAREVLLLVPGMNEAAVDTVLGRRAGEPFQDRDLLSEELSRLGLSPEQVTSLVKHTTITSTFFRIRAVAVSQRRQIRRMVEMVVRREGDVITVLSYQEA
jgi:type II secretory pathway component PulK